MALSVLTVGHSTHPAPEFVSLLQAHGVAHVVDVRTVPRSRFNPQFSSEALMETLIQAGLCYSHMPGLGGLRKPRHDSVNGGWRNDSFRGYADYMQTPAFAAQLLLLMELAGRKTTAIMCAEAVPWRCHRSLIADALTVRGVLVEHILSPAKRQPHTMTSFARVDGPMVTYPPEQPALF